MNGGSAQLRVAQLLPRADLELGEDLAQVPLHRARAEEETGTDLGVGQPVAHQQRDLLLLRRKDVANASMPIEMHRSNAVRSCARASTRRPWRRSHSP